MNIANKNIHRLRRRISKVQLFLFGLKSVAAQMGPLRLMLASLAVIMIVFTPKPGTPAVYSGWELIPTLVIPAVAPIVFLLLLFDILMSRVWMSASEGFERTRYKRIMLINLSLAAVMLIFWLPFFLAIGRVL